eukprot:2082701-Pleurochrysis_carterae.AAC.2
MHSLPSIPGVDAVCNWSLSLEEAIIGALAQKLEIPEEEDIVGRNEHQVMLYVKGESGERVRLSQRRPRDNFGYPRHHYLPLSINLLLAQLSRSRQEVAMLLSEKAIQNLPAQVERADPGFEVRSDSGSNRLLALLVTSLKSRSVSTSCHSLPCTSLTFMAASVDTRVKKAGHW